MSLLEIKNQIAGVKNTRKITKAMQLVAASKSQKFQKKALSIRDFSFELSHILGSIDQKTSQNTYLTSPKSKDTLFILYSSDKGLCGALNARLFRCLFQSEQWKSTTKEHRHIITIGKKAKSFIQFNKIEITKSFEAISEQMDNFETLKYIETILELWKTNKYQKIYMIAPHFENAFTFHPIMKEYLPLSQDVIEKHKQVDKKSFDKEANTAKGFAFFEPSEEEVINHIVENITSLLFLQSFYELKASEYSSRMIAMQNATDSANDIIHQKTLILNKARQAKITQEIAEIVGGSLA